MDQLWDYFTDRLFWERIIGNSSYMMILLCTFLFFWLMMIFSSEKSNPNAATNINKPKPSKDQKATNQNPLNTSFKSKGETLNHSTTSTLNQSTSNTSISEEDTTLNSSKYDNFNTNTSNQFEILEMNVRTYPSLINELPKGYRTVLLICNNENKNQLIELFTKVCIKYSK